MRDFGLHRIGLLSLAVGQGQWRRTSFRSFAPLIFFCFVFFYFVSPVGAPSFGTSPVFAFVSCSSGGGDRSVNGQNKNLERGWNLVPESSQGFAADGFLTELS